MTTDLKLQVQAISSPADGVRELQLGPATDTPLPSWTPGAHIDLVLAPDLVRQYSLCGDPGNPTWSVAVLHEPGGRGGSTLVHDVLGVGDVLTARGPRNHFALEPAPAYLFVAGGIGITPLLPMIAEADAAGADWRLLYGGRNRSSMAYADALAAHGWRVDLRPHDEHGLLDLDAALAAAPPEALVYCCGPEPLLAALEQRCDAGRLHVERFTPRDAGAVLGPGEFDVRLRRTGATVRVTAEQTVLAAVESAGATVLQSCREGTCGTCETAVLGGRPEHRDSVLDEAERADGATMMVCVSRSLDPVLELDL
ncbi:PDR/VanB family oxidoreductase [Pseudonocardia sp. 73-21]|mgnify:CR=1 FL=1|uniref:PDR/VanB family oxidoreductase n=1 Tax=unclassified Pseudonocardia TaxID=2619320 RepID=UPI00095D1B9C|nr:MAG: oxidoreductase [Pseudonocardia sp. 73-21]